MCVFARILAFRDSRPVTKPTGNREVPVNGTPDMEIRLLQEQLVEVDNEHLRTLESFICENLDAEFDEFLESLEAQQVSSQCNVVWTTGAIAYRCRNCQVTESRYAAPSSCTRFVGFVARTPYPMSSTVSRTLHLPYQTSAVLDFFLLLSLTHVFLLYLATATTALCVFNASREEIIAIMTMVRHVTPAYTVLTFPQRY